VADQVAKALIEHKSDNGLVVGIDGRWGSGKSSLLHLLELALAEAPAAQRPSVINFRPWLVGDRDSLLATLFREITDAIDQVSLSQGEIAPIARTRAQTAATAARRFASAIGRAGEMVYFAGEVSESSSLKLFGKGMKAVGSSTAPKAPPSLSESKQKLVEALQGLDHLFVITIDDVDRLEPMEAVEVLRLCRAVADFPNIVHVLCFDGRVLAESIQKAAGVDYGEAFLEKIVQLTVTVPTPEPFQLRNWFSDELRNIGAPGTEKGLVRLREVVNWDGGRRLQTPRSVIRAFDSIRFMWPALEEAGADFSDLVWLQLIKNDNLKLYRWIENYLSSQSVIALQIGQVDKADQEADAKALVEADTEGFFKSLHYRHHFADQLPGLDADYNGAATAPKIYQNVSKREQDKAIAEKRLSSPDHYRLYFSLAVPSHTITQAELAEFWEALEGAPDGGFAAFLQLYDRVVLGSFSKADVLIERLDTAAGDGLSQKRSRDLLILFSNVLDETYRVRSFDVFWVDTIWDRAQRLTKRLLTATGDQRAESISHMFRNGEALDWLTGLLRKETFAHGKYGDQLKPEHEWILTAQELDQASQILIDRYGKLTPNDLVKIAEPLNLLFAWRQAGDEGGPRKLVQKTIKSNENLIILLERMRGSVTSTGGRYYTLKRDSLDPFLNFDRIRQRVEKIAAGGGDPALAVRASVLIGDFRADENF
jgi:hypothetical protein